MSKLTFVNGNFGSGKSSWSLSMDTDSPTCSRDRRFICEISASPMIIAADLGPQARRAAAHARFRSICTDTTVRISLRIMIVQSRWTCEWFLAINTQNRL